MDTIPPLELPEPAMSGFPTIGLDEDSIFGEYEVVRTACSNAVCETVLGDGGSMAALSQPKGLNTTLEHVPNVIINFNFGFDLDFSPQVEKVSTQMAPEPQTENYQIAVLEPFSSHLNENTPNENFGVNVCGKPIDLLEGFGGNPDFSKFSQDTASASNNFSFLNDIGTCPTVPLDRSEMGFSSEGFHFFENAPRYNQDRSLSSTPPSSPSSSNLTVTTSPSTAATTPSIADSSTHGLFCRICHSTFTRPSDLKRHEGVHYPISHYFLASPNHLFDRQNFVTQLP